MSNKIRDKLMGKSYHFVRFDPSVPEAKAITFNDLNEIEKQEFIKYVEKNKKDILAADSLMWVVE